MYPQIIHVPLVFHFHQPVGQFEHVFVEAYKKSYSPLIKSLFRNPKVKANLHFSGPLLNWLDENRPDFFDEFLLPMINRGQIEIMTGGFYEPILVSIADEDKTAQIQKLNNYWKEKLPGITLSGLWLTERVWEPSLIRPLVTNGIEYVLIDDENLELSGFSKYSSFYPAITEDQGFSIKIVAINEQVRYLIPWQPVQKTYEYLKYIRDITDSRCIIKPNVLVFADAEKMGMWPAGDRSTYDICYKDGFNNKPWIQEFFEMLSETSWISSCTIHDYLEIYKHHTLNLQYSNAGSYDKMGIWALSSDKRRILENLKQGIRYHQVDQNISRLNRYLKGNLWRSFFTKYASSSSLHDFMYFIRSLYSKIIHKIPKTNISIERGYDLLLKAQCNDVFWHGQFGGVYFKFMREFAYHCLISSFVIFEQEFLEQTSECLINQVGKIPLLPSGPGFVLNSEKIALFISIADGGTISYIIDKHLRYNYANVFTRLIEAYHPEQGDPEKGIVNDSMKRRSFRDYLFLEKPAVEQFYQNTLEVDSSFHELPYELVSKSEIKPNLTLKCVTDVKGKVFSIEKSYNLVENSKTLLVRYKIANLSDIAIKVYVIPEINLIIGGNERNITLFVNGSKKSDFSLEQKKTFDSVRELSLFNSQLEYGYVLTSSTPIQVYQYTILTYSVSEGSYQASYQGNCVLPIIECDKNCEFEFKLKFR